MARSSDTTPCAARSKLRIKFDPDSESWWAEAEIDERHALTTGAATLDGLLERIPIVLRDLVER
jgi:hypothetical protein